MQNRFRFRIWDKSCETWLTDFAINQDGEINRFFNNEEALKRRFVLMQCTGKKDKHNKLIYEGDIVRLTAKNKMTFEYVVKYRLSEYRYVLEYTNGKLKGHKARDFSKEYAQVKNLYDGGYEVIGNIYENKELLEGK